MAPGARREVPDDVFEMDDLGLLGHVNHPVRGAILWRLEEPRSLGELALSPERRRDLVQRLSALVDEFRSDKDPDDPTAEHVALFVAADRETG
jgi:hypothetical protein